MRSSRRGWGLSVANATAMGFRRREHNFINWRMPMSGESFNSAIREQKVREKTRGSQERYARAEKSLAGGVSSGLRRSARPYPFYYTSGKGSQVTDVDGNTYLDYGLAWGPLILGHSPAEVVEAIKAQLDRGLTYGAQHDLEFEASELLARIIPCADLVCYANSGTEIVQVALRLARAATDRLKYLKFEGHYHGWDDSVLVSSHPTMEEIEAAQGAPIPVGAGQRPHDDVVVVQWNDRAGVESAFASHTSEISAVICEPILCNSGCIPPEPGFLEFLRRITSQHNSLLIFDEVITGFRLRLAGAQGLYGITPDLATYAKAIGSGAAVSALAGKAEFMSLIATGKVVHAGTLNGNPVALAAVNATLKTLARDSGALYEGLKERSDRLRSGLETLLRRRGHQVVSSGYGAVFQISFMDMPARNYRETMAADKSLYSDFALALLDEGVLVLPDGRWYVSLAHTDKDIEATLTAAARAIA
jgi:glutamate-1-semialdehyde 2,1-aminomutase